MSLSPFPWIPFEPDHRDGVRVIEERGALAAARAVARSRGHHEAEIAAGLLLVVRPSGHRHWRRRWLVLPPGGEPAFIYEGAPGVSIWVPVAADEHARVRLDPTAPPVPGRPGPTG
jgi:hypothetical protein